MIHVLATIQLAPGARAAFLAEFRKIVPLVREEKGCLAYEPTIDVPTTLPNQGPPREDVVVVVERWESVRHLEAHMVAPHMVDYRKIVKPLVVGSVLQILEPA